jgi:peptidyl-prolyl cis-trans isomerase D
MRHKTQGEAGMAATKKSQNILVWVLMALLILGLAGFGVDGFLSQRVTSIGQVGSREISAQTYARTLQQEIRALEQQIGQPLPFPQAQAFGLDAQVRAQLVRRAALEAEADRIGISVGDGNVQRTLLSIPAFQGPGGAFDRESYRFALENIGQTPAQFEDEIRRDGARAILQAATAAGVATPLPMRDAFVNFLAERHSFAVFTLDASLLPESPPPADEAAITAYYQDNIADFTTPETRRVTYATLTPEMMMTTLEVDEDALRQLYQTRIADYVQPERRLVERLVFGTEEDARAAMARIDAGESFETIIIERGLTLDDVDMGDVSEAQLGAAGAAVFALAEPGQLTGPHASNVGPALFRMNAILNAQEVTFEEARDELFAEFAGDTARRAIADLIDTFEDLIAGGATVEELAAETPMELGQIDWQVGVSDGIAAFEGFRQAAATTAPDDFPQLRALSDGGVFVLRIDAIEPPAPQPLDAVRDQAQAGANARAVVTALLALAQEWSVALAAQGADSFAEERALTPETFEMVTRTDRLAGLPQALVQELFDSQPGTPVIVPQANAVVLAIAQTPLPPDPGDPQTARLLATIDEQIGGTLAQDVFDYFARALEREAGITLNQAAIDAVHAGLR